MTVAAPWTGRGHASRRCATSCLLCLMIRTMLRSCIFKSRICASFLIYNMFWCNYVPLIVLIYSYTVVDTSDYTRYEIVGAIERR